MWPNSSSARALANSSSLELSQGPAALHTGYLLAQFQNTLKYQRTSCNVLEKKNLSLASFLEVALF